MDFKKTADTEDMDAVPSGSSAQGTEGSLARIHLQSQHSQGRMETLIRTALRQTAGGPATRTALRSAAAEAPELFFDAGMVVAESLAEGPEAPSCARLFDCPEFLIELTRVGRFGRKKLIEVCRKFLKVDKRLDIRLADLLPGRSEDKYGLPPAVVARILDVLNEISSGPRLLLILNHLTHHPNPMVAEKAVVLSGRRICNAAWTERHLASVDPGVRAGAVEGLWGRNTQAARQAMWVSLRDENDRVAGKALVGLHLLGEPSANQLATDMLGDARPPFRSTAAEVMGRIAAPEFAEVLVGATHDEDPRVRLSAKQALAAIRLSLRPEPQKAPDPGVPVAVAAEPKATAPRPELPDLDIPGPELRLDGRYVASR